MAPGVRLLAKGKDFEPEKLAARLTTKTIAVRGEMGTTFYNSAVEAGVDDSLISDFAAAFNYDVDFQFELPPGRHFRRHVRAGLQSVGRVRRRAAAAVRVASAAGQVIALLPVQIRRPIWLVRQQRAKQQTLAHAHTSRRRTRVVRLRNALSPGSPFHADAQRHGLRGAHRDSRLCVRPTARSSSPAVAMATLGR